MTQPPGGYPSSEPGSQHPPPADPFLAPPGWDPQTPNPSAGGPPAAGSASGHYQPPESPPGGGGGWGEGAPPPRGPYQPPGPVPGQPPGSPPPGPYQPPGGGGWGEGPPPGGPYDPPPSAPTSPYAPPGAPHGGAYAPPGSENPYGPPSGSPYGPPGGPPPYPPPGPPGPPPRRRRGLLIAVIAVAGALILLGGVGAGAWLLTRDTDTDGAESPVVAVQSFLQAVYTERDAAAAAAQVCSEARDQDALAAKISEIGSYDETEVNPQYSWTDPTVVEESGNVAVVAVTITLVTDEEKTSDQTLHVSVLDKDANGWWICDMETVEDAPAPDEGAEGDNAEESPAPESPAAESPAPESPGTEESPAGE